MKWYRYRIATDKYLGFEIQWRHVLLPFWVSGYSTYKTVDEAETDCIRKFGPKKIVKDLGAI